MMGCQRRAVAAPKAMAPAPIITIQSNGNRPCDDNEGDRIVVESRNASGISSLGNGVMESDWGVTTVPTFGELDTDSGVISGFDNPGDEW